MGDTIYKFVGMPATGYEPVDPRWQAQKLKRLGEEVIPQREIRSDTA